MTTVFKDMATCPVCGEKLEFATMGSTNTFGSMDLDTRPPEMMRSTMCYWLVECPECGYVSSDMEEAAPVNRFFLETDRYKNVDGYSFRNNLSNAFYRDYLIMKETGAIRDACLSLLHTIWTCDDKEDDNAIVLREKLVPLLEELLASEYDENIDIMKVDVLRRCSQFEKLIYEYKDKRFENELLNIICNFQILKAMDKDMDCYTVQDAISKHSERSDNLMNVYYKDYDLHWREEKWIENAKKVLPYMVLEKDYEKREKFREFLESEGFKRLTWNSQFPGVLVNMEFHNFALIYAPCHHSCVNDRDYSIQEFMSEIYYKQENKK